MIVDLSKSLLLDYRRLKLSRRWVLDWLLPLLSSAAAGYYTYAINPGIAVVASGGIVQHTSGLLSILFAFYAASLGVFTALPYGPIDVPVAEFKDQKISERGVTKRRLIQVVFGYLAAGSLLLYFVGFLLAVFVPNFDTFAPGPLKAGVCAAYMFGLTLVLATTWYSVWLMSHYLPSASRINKVRVIGIEESDPGQPPPPQNLSSESDKSESVS